ncbi:MAG: hypothetical protein SF187_01075 [Deltaproteobacteria bacterium]|nr:hypothetical protein [Deltaproteobacteria bacterium]
MRNGNLKVWVWVVGTAAATILATASFQATFAKAGYEGAPAVCKQWQTATLPPVIDLNAPLPEMDKPHTDTAPEGWEPFAVGHGGKVVYRRCVK